MSKCSELLPPTLFSVSSCGCGCRCLYRTNGWPVPWASEGALEGNAVRLTVDSNEPLEDTIRVVGSLYGVTLVVSKDGREAGQPTRRSTPDKRSPSDQPRRRARVPEASSRKSATAAAGAD